MGWLYLDLVREGAPILVLSQAAEGLAQGVRRNQHNYLWITRRTAATTRRAGPGASANRGDFGRTRLTIRAPRLVQWIP